MSALRPLVIFLLLFFGGGSAVANSHVLLQEKLEHLEDPQQRLTIASILRAKDNAKWQEMSSTAVNLGMSTSAHWFRYTITPNAAGRYVLEAGYPHLDEINFYRVDNGELVESFYTGDKTYFAERPLEHRYFAFPMTLKRQPETIYLKAVSAGPIQMPLKVYSDEGFFTKALQAQLLNGLYFGGMLVILMYNLIVWSYVRERSYLFYMMHVGTQLFLQFTLEGYAFQYLWPDESAINSFALLLILFAGLATSCQFGLAFLRLSPTNNPSAWYFLRGCVYVSIVGCLLGLIVPYAILMKVLLLFILVCCVALLYPGIVQSLRGDRVAIVFLLAWSVFVLGALLAGLSKLGWIPDVFVTRHSIQIGSMLEIILLSVALSVRQQTEFQQRITDLVRPRVSDVLAERVVVKNVSHSESEQQDVGRNEAHIEEEAVALPPFENALNSMLSLSAVEPLTLLVLGVDDKQLLRCEQGESELNALLEHVAKQLRRVVTRREDHIFQLDSDDFAVVMGKTHLYNARLIAERIRHLLGTDDYWKGVYPIGIRVSIGIYSAIPAQGATIEQWILNANRALKTAQLSCDEKVIVCDSSIAET
jgi:diguanylate cyclase